MTRRGRPKAQGRFALTSTPGPCAGCGQEARSCLRCGHTVCRGCVQRAGECPVCRWVEASCRSCREGAA